MEESGWGSGEVLAARLKALRAERDLSLDVLAQKSGISRATLSRLENGQTSPTAAQLAALCSAFGLTMARLMLMVEGAPPALVRRTAQPVWRTDDGLAEARAVCPPARDFSADVTEWHLFPGARLSYPDDRRPGTEHHLVMLSGTLDLTLAGETHRLSGGDAIRYRAIGASAFAAPDEAGARYLLFMVIQ